MRKITNHKGWLSAILSIIPFFIFMVFFQAIGLGVSSALGQAGIIEFNFDSYLQALDFAKAVALLAEEEDHHPKIVLEWGRVEVHWWSHKIKGLHKNDFICAAKTDQI